MAQSPSISLQDRSRFVRLITEFSVNKPHSADYNLAERLGSFVGVSGSMNLARGLRKSASELDGSGRVSEVSANVEGIKDDFLSSRKRMIRNIVRGFSDDTDQAQASVPSEATGVRAEALKTFDPYRRFYTSHQIEMAVSIKDLRGRVRTAMSRLSPELQSLAQLDTTLDESLEAHTRKQFSIAPKVLEQRFKELIASAVDLGRNDSDDEIDLNDDWLNDFYANMRELLLAELDLRMQPVVGLLEALIENSDVLSAELNEITDIK